MGGYERADHADNSPERVTVPETRAAEQATPAPAMVAGNGAFTRLLRSAAGDPPAGGNGSGPLDPDAGAAISAEIGRGAPLAQSVRADMEQHFGVDLSTTQIHSSLTRPAGRT